MLQRDLFHHSQLGSTKAGRIAGPTERGNRVGWCRVVRAKEAPLEPRRISGMTDFSGI